MIDSTEIFADVRKKIAVEFENLKYPILLSFYSRCWT